MARVLIGLALYNGAEHVAGEASGGLGDPTIGHILARDLLARAPRAVRRLFNP